MSYVLALDAGSSSVRAGLFDDRGNLVDDSITQISFELTVDEGGIAQVSAARVRELLEDAIDQTLASRQLREGEISVVGVSTYWHSLVALDAEARPISPLFSWADTRSAPQALMLRQRLDASAIHQRTGCIIHPSYLPAKIAWLGEERPDILDRAAHLVSLAQYCTGVWLGSFVSSVSMASGSGLLHLRRYDWDDELLEVLNISREQLGAIAGEPEMLPPVTDEYARRWPMLAGVPWRAPIGDGAASNVGIGCVGRDRISLMVGTSGAMRRIEADAIDELIPDGLWRYLLDRRYSVTGGALSEGGNVYAWLNNTLRLPDEDECERALASRPPTTHGLVIVPHWTGERATGWVGDATAVIAGLKLHTDPLDIYQASLEAVAYEFAGVYDRLAQGGETIIATGGGLRHSPAWLQILADALGAEIVTASVDEASLRGAALVALRDSGQLADGSLRGAMLDGVTYPRDKAHEVHRQARELQRMLYEREVGENGVNLLARQTR